MLARGTDLLIPEAVNVQGGSMSPVFRNHLLTSHVEVQKVGMIAQEAGAKRLVLSHIADAASGNSPIDVARWKRWALQGYADGKASIGQDLRRIAVRAGPRPLPLPDAG